MAEPAGRPDPSIADWLEALSHDSPFERQRAAEVWGRVGPSLAAAVRRLLGLLKDPNRDVRLQAAAALGDLGGQAHLVLPALRAALKEAALKDGDAAVRNAAAHAVLQVGPQPASEIAGLIASLKDDLDVVRFNAAIALGDLGPEAREAVPALTHAHLRDPDAAVRVEAAVALWKIDRKAASVVAVLIKALEDPNEMICWMAADCLGQMGAEAREAVPALQQALRRDFRIGLIRTGVGLALQRIDPQAAEAAGVG
jgi:hypothetical protein